MILLIMNRTTDIAIVGGGIVGLATAYQLLHLQPDLRVTVLEKEEAVAQHQTGRNSGVLHSGIYYTPGSMKAKNCRLGKEAMVAFCEAEGIDFELCGKVIVATEEEELPLLDSIFERGQANGVVCEMIGPERLREIEPYAAGLRAIHVPETGIVDYGQVANRLAARIQEGGGEIVLGAKVLALRSTADATVVETTAGVVQARRVVNCAGLHSDRVAALGGLKPDVQIVPFRGEYYTLTPEANAFCRTLIYPVPDPSFPFLGVHFTKRIGGAVECGPNAVLAFAREGYTKTDVSVSDLAEIVSYSGFRTLASRYWRTGMAEMWRSLSKAAFVRALQRLVPDIEAHHLQRAPAGVRAQAVTPDGQLADDFLIQEHGSVVHVFNAPSPAATAALNIGKTIAHRLDVGVPRPRPKKSVGTVETV
jgi:L-2-hydroxyglutarate oxidase LhgO